MIDAMLNLLFGCRHKRITRPITPVHKPGIEPEHTYVACLDCGRQFHYDLKAMRVGTPMRVPAASYRPVGGPFQSQY